MEKNLIIISAGMLGREAFCWAEQAIRQGADYRIKGFLDDRPEALAGYNYEVPILGGPTSYHIQPGDVFIGAIGNPAEKQKFYGPIISAGGEFINVIHPLANIGRNVRLGKGIIISAYVSITCDVTVGDHVAIGAFSNIGHDVVVGNWCQISSHCGLNGRAVLGDGAFVGSHGCVLPGIKVGQGAFVSAGSVAARDVAPETKVFGNPAVPFGRTSSSR